MNSDIKLSRDQSQCHRLACDNLLHLLGLDYQRLVFDQNGLKEKLTSVLEARVVDQILA